MARKSFGFLSRLFDKILSSSNEISGSVFIPEEPRNKKFILNKDSLFKFNDLKYKGSFLAFRIEGDKKSIEERKNDLTIDLELKKFSDFVSYSTTDVFLSDSF